jgi:hypothetical protein
MDRTWRTELPPETPAMQADPAIPVYRAVMARIVTLMVTDPDNATTEGDELHALVDLAQVYERRWFPDFCPQRK